MSKVLEKIKQHATTIHSNNKNGSIWDQSTPYLLVGAICFLAIWPFLANQSLPADTDAELHIYRLAELSRMVRGGEFYPRWASHFYFGYGYPIFNYYAPFSYYTALLFERLPLINAVSATKLIFVASILLGGIGTFGYVRSLFGNNAGYVAAAVFVYAPYIQYIDPHARGVSPESFALGLFPIALWALERLRHESTGLDFIWAGLAITALVTTHNIMAMIFGGLLLSWCLWQIVITIQINKTASFPALLASLAYGLGIIASSFFWLPVALERNDVNLNTLVGPEGSHFAYSSHFLSLRTLLAPTRWLDWGATEPHYLFNLGLAPWLFGFIGIGIATWLTIKPSQVTKNKKALSQISFWVLAAIGLIWLMLPSSLILWNTIPVLPFIQFPWRLLGPVAAVLAILAGFTTYQFEIYYPKFGQIIATIIIGLTLIAALPLTQPQPWPANFGETSMAAVATQENQGRWLGTTSTADFVPATVDVIPKYQDQLLDALKNNQEPDRVNYASLPTDVIIEQDQIRPLHTRYTVSSPTPFALRLFLFDFPGWQVRIDGHLIETELGLPEGFIVIPTPAGTHTIDVEFKNTSARNWGWILTLIALFSLLSVGFWLHRAASPKTAKPKIDLAPPQVLWIVIIGITIIGLISGRWLHYHSETDHIKIAQKNLSANFGDQLILAGNDISSTQLSAGDTLFTTLYWRTAAELDINYQVFIHVFAADGTLVAQSDKLNPGDFPTTKWPHDKYVRDPHWLNLPNHLSAGTYTIKVGLWVQDEGWRLPLLDENKNQIDDGFIISQLDIKE